MKKLKLLGDRPMRQQYPETIARQAALTRVLQHLGEIEQHLLGVETKED
jgi:CPA1 family monovalent cation:H+ antiporter